MDPFEPLINVLTLLTVLSVMAERATNVLKLSSSRLRNREEGERDREHALTGRAMIIGILVALIMKADFFAILGQMQDPWSTLGWVRVEGYRWTRSVAGATVGGALYATAGCVMTGIALGFGSSFWHEVLGSVRELKKMARKKADA